MIPYRVASLLSGPEGHEETVLTRLIFPVEAQAAWETIVTYEEVAEPPPWHLRALLPQPLRTVGDKSRPGADVLCLYRSGDLIKRIDLVDPPRRLYFHVVNQRIGIEACLLARGGSYVITDAGPDACAVELTTRYVSRMQPRWLWRPLEHWLTHELHRHVLAGMRARLGQGVLECQT